MIRLGVRLAFSGGWGRPALLAACTAVVAGLLLVAVSLLRIRGYAEEPLWSVASEPGTRGGMVFAVVLLGLPPLLLLHQAVRLGTARRERRLAALRLAGATPGEVRAVGAVEVGAPALIGSVLGIGVYLLMRAVLGPTSSAGPGWFGSVDGEFLSRSRGLALIPRETTPLWWQYVAVLVGVAALGVAVGLMAGRGVSVAPLGVVRRAPKGPPRPWGFLLVLAGLAVGAGLINVDSSDSQVRGVACVALLLLGGMSLSSWSAALVGRYAAARASRAHVLLAACRLATDPRSSGRAAAAVGGIALVAGGSASLLADVRYTDNGTWDTAAVFAVLLVLAMLGTALVAVLGSLAVHAVESLLDGRRSVAALGALGTTHDVLGRAQRWEAGLVTLPVTVVGVLGGSGLYALASTRAGLAADGGLWLILTSAMLVGTVAMVGLAIVVSTWLTRPWLRRATSPTNLRTE